MDTVIASGEDPRAIAQAAAILAGGGLVVFPTETVYGLGADARSAEAVAAIYAAKGRPATNPVIVHVLDAPAARALVTSWDERAALLAERFWPGPLTLVLPRAAIIPAIVAAGGPTVAVRAPRHPVARALLTAFQGPIAAPSANRSTSISPTRAEHALRELDGRVPLILDGGPAEVGLESTVLDLAGPVPRVLRPGAITAAAIAGVLGVRVDTRAPSTAGAPARSPGLLRRHYAPAHPLHVYGTGTPPPELPGRTAFLLYGEHPAPGPLARSLPEDAADYARALYDALHWADGQDVDAIALEAPPSGEAWTAVHDRLRRASAR